MDQGKEIRHVAPRLDSEENGIWVKSSSRHWHKSVDDSDFNKAVGQFGRYHPSNENVGRPNGERGSAKAERGPLGGMR